MCFDLCDRQTLNSRWLRLLLSEGSSVAGARWLKTTAGVPVIGWRVAWSGWVGYQCLRQLRRLGC